MRLSDESIEIRLVGGPYHGAEGEVTDSPLPVIVEGEPDEYYFRKTPDAIGVDDRVELFYQPRFTG